jgi:rubrerythrin
MNDKYQGHIEAIEAAMEEERKAAEFYRNGAAKSGSAAGTAFLNELADFEDHHFAKLKELRDSLASAHGFIAYEGKPLDTSAASGGEAERTEKHFDDVLDILKLAIDAEEKAHQKYSELAAKTDDELGKRMFLKLAEEEVHHRRILSDQFFQLTNNNGVWI